MWKLCGSHDELFDVLHSQIQNMLSNQDSVKIVQNLVSYLLHLLQNSAICHNTQIDSKHKQVDYKLFDTIYTFFALELYTV